MTHTASVVVGVYITSLVAIAAVAVSVILLRDWLRRMRAEDERVEAGPAAIRAVPEAADLSAPVVARVPVASVHIEPSPLRLADHVLPARVFPARRQTVPSAGLLLTRAPVGSLRPERPRIRPQHAMPPGPDTQEFRAIVERNTGRRPSGSGPDETGLRMRRTERKPGEAWEQPDLFAEVTR